LSRLPFSIRVVLESLVRLQGHPAYRPEQVTAFAAWKPAGDDHMEFPYQPARVLLQDFTGVPCIADLAALRSAMQRAGANPARIEPQIPVDLVIDHSVQVDTYEDTDPLPQRGNRIRAQRRALHLPALGPGRVQEVAHRAARPGHLPPGEPGIPGPRRDDDTDAQGRTIAFPDTLVGTDSHTTMINGLGVVGWGVGGIEAEAAMLGQPIPLSPPRSRPCA
jgi:aconitate hydratase